MAAKKSEYEPVDLGMVADGPKLGNAYTKSIAAALKIKDPSERAKEVNKELEKFKADYKFKPEYVIGLTDYARGGGWHGFGTRPIRELIENSGLELKNPDSPELAKGIYVKVKPELEKANAIQRISPKEESKGDSKETEARSTTTESSGSAGEPLIDPNLNTSGTVSTGAPVNTGSNPKNPEPKLYYINLKEYSLKRGSDLNDYKKNFKILCGGIEGIIDKYENGKINEEQSRYEINKRFAAFVKENKGLKPEDVYVLADTTKSLLSGNKSVKSILEGRKLPDGKLLRFNNPLSSRFNEEYITYVSAEKKS